MTDTVVSSATKEVVIGFDRPFVIRQGEAEVFRRFRRPLLRDQDHTQSDMRIDKRRILRQGVFEILPGLLLAAEFREGEPQIVEHPLLIGLHLQLLHEMFDRLFGAILRDLNHADLKMGLALLRVLVQDGL